ncbi:MAG: hypothetical protein OEV43_03315 [Coriobacteriia bacterium]|nr:hypothetical protein [Coriobacteriia bacterium]
MLIVPVLIVIATIAWLSYRGALPMLDTRAAYIASAEPVDGALAIARERVVRGEITTEEYERISAILRG